jgi:hypothetical protein
VLAAPHHCGEEFRAFEQLLLSLSPQAVQRAPSRPMASSVSDTGDVESSMPQSPTPPFDEKLSLPDGNSSEGIPGKPVIPASFRDPLEYLKKELSVDRLDKIFVHLWWAGRPDNNRALHAQAMMKREVVPCENINLHLVWHDTTIYVKPLPVWLLNYDFFKKNISSNSELKKQANGFLKTYTRLVAYPIDFRIAKDNGLLPDEVKTWEQWSAIAKSLVENTINEDDIHRRYKYGELRLRRLNHIYRFWRFGESYHSVYVQYDNFFTQNFGWLLLLVVYVSAILSSMQVVLATPQSGPAFSAASYWFSVVALIIIAFGVALQALLFIVLFIYHLICTIINLQRKRVEWLLYNWLPKLNNNPKAKAHKTM